jgi:hypothetical protein
VAEGVVSEPFLPSGDQDHKGGFALLPIQHPINYRDIPHKDKSFPRSIGCKTWREHGHSQELATRSNQAKQTILAETSRVIQHGNPAKIIFEFRAITILIHRVFFHLACVMLPFCDRRVIVARKDIAPVWTRSFPIAKEPKTLGQHLKKRRFLAGVRQREAAVKLGVSARILSLWNETGFTRLGLSSRF